MPLPASEFREKKVDPDAKHLGKNQIRILEFLQANPEEAYTRKEIQVTLGIKYDGAVLTALNSLKSKGSVISKEFEGKIYWGINDAYKGEDDPGRHAGRDDTGPEPGKETVEETEDVPASRTSNKKSRARKPRNNKNKSRKGGRKRSNRKK